MLGPIIEGQFNAAFNWPLGAALSFTMLAIVLLCFFPEIATWLPDHLMGVAVHR